MCPSGDVADKASGSIPSHQYTVGICQNSKCTNDVLRGLDNLHRCVSPGVEDYPDMSPVNEVQYAFHVLFGGASFAWLCCPNGVYATPPRLLREDSTSWSPRSDPGKK